MSNYGSVNAAEHRALMNRPMSDADEMRLMKLQIQRARQAAAAQPAAAKQTASVASGAKTALTTYQGKAQTHYNQWHAKNGGGYPTKAAEMADWQIVWNNSPEGKAAKKELDPHLLNYSKAVQDEMRLAAEANGGGSQAVDKKRDEITGRNNDGSWVDTVLNGIVTDLAVPIAAESPELRRAILKTDGALAERNDAAGDLDSLITAKTNALKGVRQGWMRQEISQDYDAQITAARDRLARGDLALKSAIEQELGLDLTGDVLKDAKASLADVKTLPPRLRKMEQPDAQAWVNQAQSQYDAAVAGVFDPELYTSEQVDAAVQRVLGHHPDFIPGTFANNHLFLTGAALKAKPAIDTALATLNPDDPRLPEWLKNLAGDEKTKVNAAFIIMLAQSTVPETDAEKAAAAKDPLWALSKYQPSSIAERALAEKDPMTFAMLKYLGGSLDESKFGDFNDIAQRNLARKQVEDLATAARATPSSEQKMLTLQILTMAIKDVRADYVESMVTTILGGQKAIDGVTQIQSRKVLNPDAGPAAIERASALVKANLEGSFSQDEQLQVWAQVEGPMRTYINDQWTYIAGLPDSSKDAVASTYMQAMSEVSPAPVASLVLDGLMAKLDPAVRISMDMPDFAKSIRSLVECAPYRAPDVAKWALSGDPDEGIVPLASPIKPDSDGDGVTLGKVLLDQIAARDGVDSSLYKNLKHAYDDGLKDAEKGLGAQARLEQLQLFNADRNNIVQTMFDNLLNTSGTLFTKSHSLAGLSTVERQNLIGQGLRIPIDNPSAKPGDALYSDPDKLKRINWIIDHAVEIGGDNPTVTFTPAIYASKDSGSVTVVMLVRVEGDKNGDGVITRKAVPEQIGTKPLDDEDMIIDATVVDPEIGAPALKDENVPWKYTDFQSFREDNQLSDDGLLFMTNNTNDLLLRRKNDGHADVNLGGIDAAIFTGWEKFRRGADITLGIAAVVAGGFLIVGSGGLLAPLVATGAAVWFGVRTLETAGEMTEHGQSLNPFNSKSENAWLGCIDPAAGTLWLGGIASVSGLAAMKPLLLLREASLLGRAITPAERLALSGMNVSATEFKTAWQTDLLLNNGLRTNIYQGAIRSVPETLGGNIVKWGVNGTAITSGGALMVAQGASFLEAMKQGQIDFSDWSLNSATWDFMLFGLGAVSFGAGVAASFKPRPVPTNRPGSDIALPDHLIRPVFWAHEKPDGTFVSKRVGPDGTMIADLDAPWANGLRPEHVTVFETYLGADGARAPRRRLDFIGSGDGHYRIIVTEADGRVWSMNDQPGGASWTGHEPTTTYAHQNADGSYRVTNIGDPSDPTFRVNFTALPDNFRPMLGSGDGVIADPDTGPATFQDFVAPMGYSGHNTGSFPPPGGRVELPAGSDGATPVRYLAHTDADGVQSLGLFAPDGRTTAEVNAPWMRGNPPEVQVLETSVGADGQVVRNAVHMLNRNADGTYSGKRLDTDGNVTAYTTGTDDAVHPLTGIQLFNGTHAPESGQPTWTPTANHTQDGGTDTGAGEMALWQGGVNNARIEAPAEPANAGGAANPPGGGKPPLPPTPGEQPGAPMGDEGPLDLGPLLRVDVELLGDTRTNSRDEVHTQGAAADRPVGESSSIFAEAFRILRPGGSLVIETGTGSVANPAQNAAMLAHLRQLGFQDVRFFRLTEEGRTFGRIVATRAELPRPAGSLQDLLDAKIASPSTTAYSLYSQYQVRAALDPSAPEHVTYLRDLSNLGQNRPEGAGFISQIGEVVLGSDNRPLIGEDGKVVTRGDIPADPLLRPILDGAPAVTYSVVRGTSDFFHYTRAGADPDTVGERIYINAAPDHATEVMGFVVANIVDNPGAFPGVAEAKIAGRHSAGNRRENIVIYIDTPANRELVLAALDDYFAAHPDHFRPGSPPMTDAVMPGISTAAEPTPWMIANADTILGRQDGDYSFGGIRAEAIELAYQDTLAALGKTTLDAGDGAAFAQNVAARFAQFGIDPVNPARNLPQGIPVVPTRADADLALQYSGMQLGDSWGVLVRDIDPETQDIRITEVHENELLFFDPATRRTFGRLQNDGTPPLQFEDGARVYHPGTNREYIYNAARQRFEPLTVPADAQLYYNPDHHVTFIRHPNGALEFFARGDYPAAKGQQWTPGKTEAANEPPAGAGWQFNAKQNRTYAPDATGQLRPLNTGDLLAHYNAADGATYVVDPVTGKVAFFGQGDNRNPELAPRPGWVQKAGQWGRDTIGDKRIGVAGRGKLPFAYLLRWFSGPTEISAGRSLGTKTGVSKPHKSDRWWEFKNAPLAFLLGISNQEAFQFKASTFVKMIGHVIGGKADKSPFNVEVVGIGDELRPYEANPAKTVVELTVTLQVKTDDARLLPGETDFFGSRTDVRAVPNGIPFNKVMSEIKVNLPVWARALIAAKYGASFQEFVYALTFRPSAESRPEISIAGIPEGARLSEEFLAQVSASLGQSRVRIQLVTDDPAGLRSALEQDPNLANHAGRYDADTTLIYVPRGPISGMRLSSVTGEHGRLHITDLTGLQREVLDPSQMNLDVIFNKRASLDYWADRYLLWPIKKGLSSSPAGQWWGQTRFGRRLQPQPHFTPGHGFYRSIRDANQKAARRATLAVTPINLLGILTGEVRAASKSAGKPDDLPKALKDIDLVYLDWTYDDGSKASVTVPGWLAELVLTGSTGEGVVWPKGGAAALMRLLDHWQSSFAARPDRVEPLLSFRKTLLPQYKEGDYLTRAQVTEILNFLEAMA